MAEIIDTSTPLRGEDLTGRKFGRLKVVRFAGRKRRNERTTNKLWECRCDCGARAIVEHGTLVHQTRSCGCAQRESVAARNYKHGLCGHPLHLKWGWMKTRCHCKRARDYRHYGGRGIYVCDAWRNSFLAFYNDMIGTWRPGLEIERIDNDGPYVKWNCRWATRAEQTNNSRSNVVLVHDGKARTVSQWSDIVGIKYGTLISRVARGWESSDALTRPIGIRRCARLIS